MECLSSQKDEYLRIDNRYYFLAFLNRSEYCIEIRSKGICIMSEDVIFRDSYKTTGYGTYIIPLATKITSKDAHLDKQVFNAS